MTDVTRILAGIDFSPSSLAALDFALGMASKEAEPALHVVHAMSLPTLPLGAGDALVTADFDRRIRVELEKALHDLVAPRRASGIPIESHLVDGPAPAALVSEAKALHCRRIVVGTAGRTALPRLLLGSVAERVARTSPIEVLVVPTPAESAPHPPRIRNIVVATDFSGPAEVALFRALDIARQHDARIHLVHGWHVAPYVERMPELCESIQRDLARELDALAHRHEAHGVPILRHMRRGDARGEITAAVGQYEADLVIVGTTGKGALDRFLLGSVAESVIRASPVPVLVARSQTTA